MSVRPVKLYMGIPSMGKRHDAQVYALRKMEKRYEGIIEFVYPEQYVGRMFHDFARNAYVDAFLETDCDILWFLDSDVVPHPDTLEIITLHQHKWVAAGAPYAVFMTPVPGECKQCVYTVYNGTNGESMNAAHVPDSGTEFVDGLGTGNMFLKREVFANLSKPYFEFILDPESKEIKRGEDLDFCIRLNQLGIRFFTDYSKVASHFKEVNMLEVNNYAMQYAKVSVAKYADSIKADLRKALKEAFENGRASAEMKQSRLILPDSVKSSRDATHGLILP